MCTLGAPSVGLNSQPFTIGAHRGFISANHRCGFAGQTMAEKNQPVGFFAPQHHRVAFFALLVVLRVANEH